MTKENTPSAKSSCCGASLKACENEICQEDALHYGYDCPMSCSECSEHCDVQSSPDEGDVERLLESLDFVQRNRPQETRMIITRGEMRAILGHISSLKSRLERAEVDLHSYRFDADRMFHALKILAHVDDGQESNGTDVYVRGVASGTIASLSNQYPSSK